MRHIERCITPAGSLHVRIADRFWSRALGLLVGKPLDLAEGLLIAPCSSIHTLGMRYPIDVVFLDRDAHVVRVCAHVAAGRMRIARGAYGVLELRAGIAARHGLQHGTRLASLAAAIGKSEESVEPV